MQYRQRNLNHVFANTNHCGSIFDRLSRLSARVNARRVLKSWTMMYLNCISTALAENTLTTMDLANRAVIRPHLAPGRLIHFSADNSDINDGTLDGKHTLHAMMPHYTKLAKRPFSYCYTEHYDTSKACNVCRSWRHGHYISCQWHRCHYWTTVSKRYSGWVV